MYYTNMNTFSYRTIIEHDENGTFHGYVPALPGCHTWGATLDETRKLLRDAIYEYLQSLMDDGETIPQDVGYEMVETVMLRNTSGNA